MRAEFAAYRMNRREIDDVVSELGEPRQSLRGVVEGAVASVRRLRSREELVPRREARLWSIDINPDLARVAGEIARREELVHLREQILIERTLRAQGADVLASATIAVPTSARGNEEAEAGIVAGVDDALRVLIDAVGAESFDPTPTNVALPPGNSRVDVG